MEIEVGLVGPIITAAITAAGVYVAIVSRLTATETLIEELKKSVEKHNRLVERTYRLEAGQNANEKRLDEAMDELREIRDDIRAIKIGGTD